ncbi:MAG: substrate-binding domain-containing protein [Kiritimatiellia bacterium]
MSERARRKFVRQVRPRIVVSLAESGAAMMPTIIALAREWNWDLLDYSLVYGEFPADPTPTGALIDTLGDGPLAQHLCYLGCRIVRLGWRTNPFDRLLPAVLPDMEAAGSLAARHFLDRAFTHLAYLGWSADPTRAQKYLLYHGLCKYAENAGVSIHLYEMGKRHIAFESPAERFERMKGEIGQWLKSLPKPIGITTYGDTMAAKLCVICRRIGLNVPEEVAILGCGNSTWCERAPVELSSIMLNEALRAHKAMHLLRDMMAGKAYATAPIMVPPEGIEQRRSTDILAVGDLVVAKALRFIWEHMRENIGVQNVADAVGLSARQLERRFLQSLGITVNQKLVQRRLDEVKHLLRTTELSVTDIAPRAGFLSPRHLHRSFLREVGVSPIQYRQGGGAKQ